MELTMCSIKIAVDVVWLSYNGGWSWSTFQQYLISAISAIRNMYSINTCIYTPYPVLVYCCGNAFKVIMQHVYLYDQHQCRQRDQTWCNCCVTDKLEGPFHHHFKCLRNDDATAYVIFWVKSRILII